MLSQGRDRADSKELGRQHFFCTLRAKSYRLSLPRRGSLGSGARGRTEPAAPSAVQCGHRPGNLESWKGTREHKAFPKYPREEAEQEGRGRSAGRGSRLAPKGAQLQP